MSGLPPGLDTEEVPGARRLLTWALATGPLLLLLLFVGFLIGSDALGRLGGGRPPVEDLVVQRTVLTAEPASIELVVVNGGEAAVTVAQVMVDDAYWSFSIDPTATVEPLRTANIRLDYPWIEGQPLAIGILTSTGAVVRHEIAVPVATPPVDADLLLTLGLVGLYVGVIPVAIGLLWLPSLRRMPRRGLDFVLAITVGLLLFLVVDAVVEGVGLAATIPDVFDGVGLLLLGAVAAVAAVTALRPRDGHGRPELGGSRLATTIAIGIGLHNLGEGLAVATAYAIGVTTLSTRLAVGFALHNATEGLAIAAPLAGSRPSVWRIAGLGLLAGAPAILGAWIGGIVDSPPLALLFLGLGIGAIVVVLAELWRVLAPRAEAVVVAGGVAVGVAIMYVTGLVVG